jgi:hypothetical protein
MKRTRIKPTSERRAKLAPKRAAFVADQLAQRPQCEAGPIISEADQLIRESHGWCTGQAVTIHEPLLRSRGGSIVDVDNSVAICDPCHRWVHDHPEFARELGLMRSVGDPPTSLADFLDRGGR